MEPAGEAVWAKTGQVEGAGVAAPAGAAPGSDVVAAMQGPLEAVGGVGRPGVGAPQSGAKDDKERLRQPCLNSREVHRPGRLGQPTTSSQRYWARTCNSLCFSPESHRCWVKKQAPKLGVGPRVLGPQDGSRRRWARGCSGRTLRCPCGGLGSTLGLWLPWSRRSSHSTLRLRLWCTELELGTEAEGGQ